MSIVTLGQNSKAIVPISNRKQIQRFYRDVMNAIWLELRTLHAQKLKKKILEFGIEEIDYWDKEHFYFQAPGGRVFRFVGDFEDISKWQN